MTKQPFNEAVLELLRRAEMATQGEWQVGYRDGTGKCDENNGASIVTYPYKENSISVPVVWGGSSYIPVGVEKSDDADFIAFARNFAEQYKDELREIAEEREALINHFVSVDDLGLVKNMQTAMKNKILDPDEQDCEPLSPEQMPGLVKLMTEDTVLERKNISLEGK